MVAVNALRVDGAARVAASLLVAVALGLGAHLLGTPFGHDGSLRDVLVLLADVAAIGLLAKRGELDPEHLSRNRPRCWIILVVALVIAATLIASERAPDALWDLAVSSAILALTAFVAALVIVVFAEQAARATSRAFSALARWLKRGGSCAGTIFARSRRPERARRRLDRFNVRSRRGPPLLP